MNIDPSTTPILFSVKVVNLLIPNLIIVIVMNVLIVLVVMYVSKIVIQMISLELMGE